MKKFFNNLWVVGILSSIIATVLYQLAVKIEVDKNKLYAMLVVQIWPIWIGLLTTGIFWFIRFLYRLYNATKILTDQMSTIAQGVGELIEHDNWVMYHSPNYDLQEFANLEEKINYLISKKIIVPQR